MMNIIMMIISVLMMSIGLFKSLLFCKHALADRADVGAPPLLVVQVLQQAHADLCLLQRRRVLHTCEAASEAISQQQEERCGYLGQGWVNASQKVSKLGLGRRSRQSRCRARYRLVVTR